MPSPKWKLVVDIGDVEETTTVPISAAAVANAASVDSETATSERLEDVKDNAINPSAVTSTDHAFADSSLHQQVQAAAVAASVGANAPSAAVDGRDPRVESVVALLGEFMPSDTQSPLSSYQFGFMKLRLLLLKQSRSPEEEEIVRTMLDSYSSYTAGGRLRQDIAVMLARDYMFLSNQQPPAPPQQLNNSSQQPSMMNLENPMMHGASHVASSSNSAGLSLFGLPSTNSSLQNSPALAPIPVPGSHDSMSIVSN